MAMQLFTSRFGTVDVETDDILLFPLGIAGFEHVQHWVLLADADNDAVAWLQSVQDPATALAVVSPRRFVPDYQVRVGRNQLSGLEMTSPDDACVLAVLARNEGRLTLNLKAPLLLNLEGRLGRQVISNDEQPLQLDLAGIDASVRIIALLIGRGRENPHRTGNKAAFGKV
jgi:flagellar assembly factor FliW